MKSGRKLAELIQFLERQQQESKDKMEIYAVSNCGLENEKVMYGLEEISEKAGYLTIVIVKRHGA